MKDVILIQLYRAGFKFKPMRVFHDSFDIDGKVFKVPCLEELIDHCGGNFWCLETLGPKWIARGFNDAEINIFEHQDKTFHGLKAIHGDRRTAVAMLWLEIQSRKNNK